MARRRPQATAGTAGSGEPAFVSPVTVAADPLPGVNLVGFLQAESGLGEAARKLQRAIARAGVPMSAITYRRTAARQEHPYEPEAGQAPYDTNILCLNPDHLEPFVQDVGPEFLDGRYTIGVWFWETSIFPREHLPCLRFVDEIWVATEYVKGVVAAETDQPVLVVPLPVEEPTEPALTRADVGFGSEFTFLFSFDFFSVFHRKNPIGLVDAFRRAFEPGEGPVLVLKSINGDSKPRRLAELRDAIAGRPDIRLVDGFVSAETKDAMMARCDCYVSLHRSEGFGLTLAEAMSYGRPVIATGYSGNLDFMDESDSYLVPYRLTRIPADWAFSPGAEWADPDIEAAASLMRHVYEHPDEALARGESARRDILERLSPDRTQRFVSDRLTAIRTSGAFARRSTRRYLSTGLLRASGELKSGVGGSLVDRRSSSAAPRSWLRRFLRRGLWPHLAAQHRIDEALVDELVTLQRAQDDLRRRVSELEARLAAETNPVAGETEPSSAGEASISTHVVSGP